jgi:transcriptional regulator with XRE-family HTH domain
MRKSTHSAGYRVLRERLEATREAAGLSQRELGRRIGVPHSWVAKVESGERRIDLIEFGWFCEACGVDAGEAARIVLAAAGTSATGRKTARGSGGGKGGGR